MSVDKEMVREIIAKFKAFALTTEYEDATDLAKQWFAQEEGFHNDWSLLGEPIKELWIYIATAAIREIETGEPTPEQ